MGLVSDFLQDTDALPDRLVKEVIHRVLRLGKAETAYGLYLTHVFWRRDRGLPYLSPEEVGFPLEPQVLKGSNDPNDV